MELFSKKFINKKNSTRDLSKEDFIKILPILAEELSRTNFHYSIDNEKLSKDWKKLKKFE